MTGQNRRFGSRPGPLMPMLTGRVRRRCARVREAGMGMGRNAPPQLDDALLPGRLAELLGDHGEAGLTEALDLVVAELGLHSAVLRDADAPEEGAHTRPAGRLRALAGEAAGTVPGMRVVPSGGSTTATVELPVRSGG